MLIVLKLLMNNQKIEIIKDFINNKYKKNNKFS